MDVVFSCPGWILSRNTKAVRSRGQSQCFLHGAGAQGGHRQHWTELARGGLGCPDRVQRGAWAPFDFPSTPSEKLQGGVKQRKDPTEYRRRESASPDSISQRESPPPAEPEATQLDYGRALS